MWGISVVISYELQSSAHLAEGMMSPVRLTDDNILYRLVNKTGDRAADAPVWKSLPQSLRSTGV